MNFVKYWKLRKLLFFLKINATLNPKFLFYPRKSIIHQILSINYSIIYQNDLSEMNILVFNIYDLATTVTMCFVSFDQENAKKNCKTQSNQIGYSMFLVDKLVKNNIPHSISTHPLWSTYEQTNKACLQFN